MQSLERSTSACAAVAVIWFPFAWVSAIELWLHSRGIYDNAIEYAMSTSEEMRWIATRMGLIAIGTLCTGVYIATFRRRLLSSHRVVSVEAVLSWVFQVAILVAAHVKAS
jgi:hypothetical protein